MTTTNCKDVTRFLVVDDHGISSSYTVAALRQTGGSVKQARNASEAFTTALAWRPHVIFMDIRLPDGNGLELIREIRAAWPENQPRPSCIVLSAENPGDGAATDSRFGVDRILVKPVSADQLREAARIRRSDGESKFPNSEHAPELQQLFIEELDQRLPELDASISALNRNQAAAILHQLIASSAICSERGIEADLRRLDSLILDRAPASQTARAYYALLESTREFTERVRRTLD